MSILWASRRSKKVHVLRTCDGELHPIPPDKLEELYEYIERWTDLDRTAARKILASGRPIRHPAFTLSLE